MIIPRAWPRQRQASAAHFLPFHSFSCAFTLARPFDDEPSLWAINCLSGLVLFRVSLAPSVDRLPPRRRQPLYALSSPTVPSSPSPTALRLPILSRLLIAVHLAYLASVRFTSLGLPLARSRSFGIAAASYSQEVLPNSLVRSLRLNSLQ